MKSAKTNKGISVFLTTVNIIGVICLIYFAMPYIMHDTTISNPGVMLPCEAWDGAGMTLTVGFIPLLIANVLGSLWVRPDNKYVRVLFIVPSIICFIIVGSYWIG